MYTWLLKIVLASVTVMTIAITGNFLRVSYFTGGPFNQGQRAEISSPVGFRGAHLAAGLNQGKGAGISSPAIAPEIDAASGTSAIALLAGVLLLVAERSRARRS